MHKITNFIRHQSEKKENEKVTYQEKLFDDSKKSTTGVKIDEIKNISLQPTIKSELNNISLSDISSNVIIQIEEKISNLRLELEKNAAFQASK